MILSNLDRDEWNLILVKNALYVRITSLKISHDLERKIPMKNCSCKLEKFRHTFVKLGGLV